MLYICGTPIGNLKDITIRALEVLQSADIILCEDTRQAKILLNAHNIQYKKLIPLHEHNEQEATQKVLEWLHDSKIIVQITDAGTPGISDPGARLCERVTKEGFKISPLPGACAYISLLSVSGVNTPSLFYGFLPSTRNKRVAVLRQWCDVAYAVAIYESPHRIIDCMSDIVDCLGENRTIVMGRELTKQFETIKKLPAYKLLDFIINDKNQQKGEFVLLILPNTQKNTKKTTLTSDDIKITELLALHLPPKKVANIVSALNNIDKDLVYQYLINYKKLEADEIAAPCKHGSQ